MKITKKIAISFFIIAILPITLIGLLIALLGHYQISLIEDKYGIEISGYEKMYNTVEILDQITDNVRKDIKEIKKESPKKLADKEYLKTLNDKLYNKYTFIVVKKGDDIIFNGSSGKGQETIANIESIIEPFLEDTGNEDKTMYIVSSKQYLVKPEYFTYDDGDSGSIFIISRLNSSIPEIHTMNVVFIIIVVACMILIGSCLMLWIYNGVLKPVQELKKAANNISNGNVDFKIKQYKNNEFGELSEAFEEMRSHLKESIEENIKRDEESKELISNISHDLKTPLTTIKGYVEGIMDGVADSPEKMDKYIRTIYNKANDMDRLIGELTIYSKIDTN